MGSHSIFFLAFILALSAAVGMARVDGSEEDERLQGSPFLQRLSRLGPIRRRLDSRRASFSVAPASPAFPWSSSSSQGEQGNSRVYRVTLYGADPTGQTDSTDAILRAVSDAFNATSNGELSKGIPDLGGVVIHLEGGSYKISSPIRFPSSGGGNLKVHSGSLHASDQFPADRHLIELWPASVPKINPNSAKKGEEDGDDTVLGSSLQESFAASFEFITLSNLLLDCNFRGGGISVISSLRTTIDTCFITHFSTDGILVQGGHETYIRNCFVGQHITAGGDPNERNFSGTGIKLLGNDNAVTDVVIFSAAVGILVAGQANVLTGVHCYNKATGFGGTGIYVQLPGQAETRIVNCYLDYTGVVVEDPVLLHISNSFFLGDAYILLKSIKGVVRGLNIVDNMFVGSGASTGIVQLDQSRGPFNTIEQVHVDRNTAQGMVLRSTIAKVSIQGNQSLWTVDFSELLLFPNLIRAVDYALQVKDSFPRHALRTISDNRVVIETDGALIGTLYASVDQNM